MRYRIENHPCLLLFSFVGRTENGGKTERKTLDRSQYMWMGNIQDSRPLFNQPKLLRAKLFRLHWLSSSSSSNFCQRSCPCCVSLQRKIAFAVVIVCVSVYLNNSWRDSCYKAMRCCHLFTNHIAHFIFTICVFEAAFLRNIEKQAENPLDKNLACIQTTKPNQV